MFRLQAAGRKQGARREKHQWDGEAPVPLTASALTYSGCRPEHTRGLSVKPGLREAQDKAGDSDSTNFRSTMIYEYKYGVLSGQYLGHTYAKMYSLLLTQNSNLTSHSVLFGFVYACAKYESLK